MFYYLMKLHYSQTPPHSPFPNAQFYYLMKLHYSQTREIAVWSGHEFYYLMKLHYSQTPFEHTVALAGFTTL